MKKLGNYWNDKSCEIYEIEGKNIVINNHYWNGDFYYNCFEVDNDLIEVIGDVRFSVKPVYKFEIEHISITEDNEDDDELLQVVDYKIIDVK